jgi:outer membrane protein TolC
MVGLVLSRLYKIVFYVVIYLLVGTKAYSFTVYEVIEKIVNNSPELRIIFEKKNQAIEDYKTEKSAYMPQIYAILNREYNKNDPIVSSQESAWASSNKFQLVLDQRLFDLEQVARIVKSGQLLQSQEFENQKLLETLIQLAIVAYFDVIQGEYIVSINKEYIKQIKEMEALTIQMRKQGDATLGDVNLVQSRLASANSNYVMAQSNLDKTKVRLSYLLNLVDKNQLVNNTNILPDLSNKDFYDLGDKIVNLIPLTPDVLLNRVLAGNVDILTFRSNLCVAGYDVEVQKTRYLPSVNFTTELNSEEQINSADFQRFLKATIEAKYTIYDGGSRASGVRKYTSALKELEYQYDVLVRDTSDQSYSSLNLLTSYEQQRVSILKEIETTEEVDRVYALQFKFATRSLLERLDNLERLTTSRTQLVNVDYNILITRINLLILMGSFVEFFGFQNYLEVSNLRLC